MFSFSGLLCFISFTIHRLDLFLQYLAVLRLSNKDTAAFRHPQRVKMEPIVKATIQACILSTISNVLAQLIACHREGVSTSTEPHIALPILVSPD